MAEATVASPTTASARQAADSAAPAEVPRIARIE
jgi:hypothetical protein